MLLVKGSILKCVFEDGYEVRPQYFYVIPTFFGSLLMMLVNLIEWFDVVVVCTSCGFTLKHSDIPK